uniref:Secreted protein n=1 Tax=Arundo donax TaxID=35708 RepID=A0A0A9D3Y7_ARUDO
MFVSPPLLLLVFGCPLPSQLPRSGGLCAGHCAAWASGVSGVGTEGVWSLGCYVDLHLLLFVR